MLNKLMARFKKRLEDRGRTKYLDSISPLYAMPITNRKVIEFDSMDPREAIATAWETPGANRKVHIKSQQKIIEIAPELAMAIGDRSTERIVKAWSELTPLSSRAISQLMPGLGIGIENLVKLYVMTNEEEK